MFIITYNYEITEDASMKVSELVRNNNNSVRLFNDFDSATEEATKVDNRLTKFGFKKVEVLIETCA